MLSGNRYRDEKDISGCAISGIMSEAGERFNGDAIIASIANMHERSNGLGGGFAAYGAVDMQVLIPVADRVLVCRTDFPDRHAWLVTGALAGTDLVPDPAPLDAPDIPQHPGSLAYLAGAPEPTDG